MNLTIASHMLATCFGVLLLTGLRRLRRHGTMGWASHAFWVIWWPICLLMFVTFGILAVDAWV